MYGGMRMSKDYVWCKLQNKKCVEPNIYAWDCGVASDCAKDSCCFYEKYPQRYHNNIPILDDSCKNAIVKKCGREKMK